MTDAAFWDKIAPKYAKDAIADLPAYEQTRDRMRDILQPHHRVLELGCGTGSTALELADKVDRYHGTDVSPGMIAIAQGKQSDETPAHLSFSARAAGDLPKGPHDVVIALNLFHLLPNLETVLETVWDTLRGHCAARVYRRNETENALKSLDDSTLHENINHDDKCENQGRRNRAKNAEPAVFKPLPWVVTLQVRLDVFGGTGDGVFVDHAGEFRVLNLDRCVNNNCRIRPYFAR